MVAVRTTVVLAVLAVCIAAVAAPTVAAASSTARVGGACSSVGTQVGGGPGVTLVCSRVNGKLVWTQLPVGAHADAQACPKGGVQFTKNLIDPASVAAVAPIGGQTGSGGVIAVRSYVSPRQALAGRHLPLYAPTALTLVGASHYQLPGSPYAPEYSLSFDAGCGITVNLFHVKEVSARLASVVPAKPSPSSGTARVSVLAVAAGEQIGGYVPGGKDGVAFDFWVDNANVTNTFITPARYAHSNHLHAVCPYTFYTPALRAVWLGKLGTNGGQVVPGTSCGTVSQGVLGTSQGQWFRDRDPALGEVDVLRYDGTYMSQGVISIDSAKGVRIGGFWSPTYVMVGPNDPSWADPTTVTASHCWSDGNHAVSVQLDGPKTMRVAVVAGLCTTPVPAGEWRTYYR